MVQIFPGFPDKATYEDSGLFPNDLTKLQVQLLPVFEENRRGDWLCRAVLEGGQAVEVIFAGRRLAVAKGLQFELMRLKAVADRKAARRGRDKPTPDQVRTNVLIEGGWRRVFQRDLDGMETRRYQLVAARWSYIGLDGTVEVAGEPVRRASGFTPREAVTGAQVPAQGVPA